MVAFELPREYGYVVLVLILYIFLDLWMASRVIEARMKYNVLYPALYAITSENKDAKLFNCIQFGWQRGHQNSVELMSTFFVLLLIGGLRHPVVCAAFGVCYIVVRYFYFKGYSSGFPSNRLKIWGLKLVPLFGIGLLLVLILSTASFGMSLLY